MNVVKHRSYPMGTLGSLRREMDDLFGRFLEDWPLASFGERRSSVTAC